MDYGTLYGSIPAPAQSEFQIGMQAAIILDVQLWEVVIYMIQELEQSPEVHVTGG